MMLTVTMIRKGFDDRECRVRVMHTAVEERLRAEGFYLGDHVHPDRVAAVRNELAREAAVRRWFGHSRTWGPDRQFPHRGQVWRSSTKSGGQDAVTDMITLRVR